MPISAEHYPAASERAAWRNQAFRAWAVALSVAALWLLATISPAVLAAEGDTTVSSALYHFFGYICHQLPDRSFFLDGHKLGVCSRCFGVYAGLFAGFAVYPLWRSIDNIEPLPRIWLLLSVVPIGIDWALGVFGIWANTFASRFVTGTILGLACATYIAPAIIEIVRNLSHKRRANIR